MFFYVFILKISLVVTKLHNYLIKYNMIDQTKNKYLIDVILYKFYTWFILIKLINKIKIVFIYIL